MLFDRICRENGIEHLLTAPRSPTTTGKIERFHRSLRIEFLAQVKPFSSPAAAQQALDEWVRHYNFERPHRAIEMATPAERFNTGQTAPTRPREAPEQRGGGQWVSRNVSAVGIVCVAGQQISVGAANAGTMCDVHVDGDILRLWLGSQLVKTVARTNRKEIRKKNAAVTGGRT